MPSAAFSAARCRLSDIDGLTAAVSASTCTDEPRVHGQRHGRDHLGRAQADHGAAQDRAVVGVGQELDEAVGLALHHRPRVCAHQMLGHPTRIPSMRACRSEMPALAISGRVKTHHATPV